MPTTPQGCHIQRSVSSLILMIHSIDFGGRPLDYEKHVLMSSSPSFAALVDHLDTSKIGGAQGKHSGLDGTYFLSIFMS
jgi:hypothetical protein